MKLYFRSLGLAIPPRIRFLQKQELMRAKQLKNIKDESHEKENYAIRASSAVDASYSFYDQDDEENSSDDGIDSFLVKKKPSSEEKDNPINDVIEVDDETNLSQKALKKLFKPQTKAAVAKKMLKKNIIPNKKTVFDDEGDIVEECPTEMKSEVVQELRKTMEEKISVGGGIDIEITKQIMAEEDKFDKKLFNKKIKAAHKVNNLLLT